MTATRDEVLEQLSFSLGHPPLPRRGNFWDIGLERGQLVAHHAPGDPDHLQTYASGVSADDDHLPLLVCDLRRGLLMPLSYRLGRPGLAVAVREELGVPVGTDCEFVLTLARRVRRRLSQVRLAMRFGAEFASEELVGPGDRYLVMCYDARIGVLAEAATMTLSEARQLPLDGRLVADLDADEVQVMRLGGNGGAGLLADADAPDIEKLLAA